MEKEKINENSYDEKESKEETVETSEVMEDKEFEETNENESDSLEKKIEELEAGNKKLLEEKESMEKELNSAKDRLLRVTAEYDNYRKRTAKEKEGIYTDACEDILKNILPVLDNLERASAVDGNSEDIKKGIEMTLRQFKGSLEKLQVEEIPTDGEFDPNMHNAVMHIEDDNYGANSIAEVFQKGYKRGNKVLRHSMVKVAN